MLTKSEFMRDKGFWARVIGSFMSEATTNASMVLNAVDKYNLDMKQGMSRQQAWKKNKDLIGRTFYVYSVGAVLLAAVQAAADAWRDDDEYEEYGEKYADAFLGNLVDELSPLNKLPIINQGWELLKALFAAGGFSDLDLYGQVANLPFADIADQLIKSVQIFTDKIMGENTNYTWYAGIHKLLQAASGVSGLPMATATREFVSVWNNTVASFAPSLRIVTYEATQTETRNALYKAILSGDEKEIARIEAKYDEQKDIDAALRKALRENDPRIREAAEAADTGKGAVYAKLVNEIVKEGHFERRIIVGAIAAELDRIKEEKKKTE